MNGFKHSLFIFFLSCCPIGKKRSKNYYFKKNSLARISYLVLRKKKCSTFSELVLVPMPNECSLYWSFLGGKSTNCWKMCCDFLDDCSWKLFVFLCIYFACYFSVGHLEMVRFLLEAGADREHKTDEMHTALMEASMDGHVEVARLLLDSGAQVR